MDRIGGDSNSGSDCRGHGGDGFLSRCLARTGTLGSRGEESIYPGRPAGAMLGRWILPLDSLVSLNALAALCCHDQTKERRHIEEARALSGQIAEADGLRPKLFSFVDKRQITKDEFLAQITDALHERRAKYPPE